MESVHGTLVGATVSTETFTADNADVIVVHFRSGTGPIYFTVDGSTPTVAGADTFVVIAGARTIRVPSSDAQTVKLISTTADTYSIEVMDA